MAIVTVLTDQEALAGAAAERVTSLVEASIAVRRGVRLCLTGGTTPRRLYELLADPSQPWRARIDWTRVHLFWGDERHVPPDHSESNFGMAQRALLAHVPIPANQVHRMRGELADAADAAREYEARLRPFGLRRSGAVLSGVELNPPRQPEPLDKLTVAPSSVEWQGSAPDALFDVMLLGLGDDAHIASLFPGSPLIDHPPREERVAAVWTEHLNAWRITLTPPALLDAHAIILLVSGSHKADAVHAALDGAEDVTRWPAQLLRPAGDRVEWFIDSAAARWRAAPPS